MEVGGGDRLEGRFAVRLMTEEWDAVFAAPTALSRDGSNKAQAPVRLKFTRSAEL